jgi:hypothetical protein
MTPLPHPTALQSLAVAILVVILGGCATGIERADEKGIRPAKDSTCQGVCIPITGTAGTKYHLIIGFGIIATNEAVNGVTATQAQGLGVSISDRPGLKLGLGYASSTVVTVAPGAADVRVEVSQKPGGPLVVDTPNAKFNQSKVKGVGHGQESK